MLDKVLNMSPPRVITVGGWVLGSLALLVASVVLVPRAITPFVSDLPQGSAELLSYYAAWWLIGGLTLGELARGRGVATPRARAFAVLTAVMVSSLVLAAAIVRPLLYPAGTYLNRGLQSVYVVVAALILPNIGFGTVLLWRSLKLSLLTSVLVSIAWGILFLAGLAVAALLVETLLVIPRRG